MNISPIRPHYLLKADAPDVVLTDDDQLRQTTFLGWRDDKKAEEVVLEQCRRIASKLRVSQRFNQLHLFMGELTSSVFAHFLVARRESPN
jgi:hypothetical protein